MGIWEREEADFMGILGFSFFSAFSESVELCIPLKCATSLMQKGINGKKLQVLPVQDAALQLLYLRNVNASE